VKSKSKKKKPKKANKDLRIFAGGSNPDLARKVAGHLGMGLGELAVRRFADGETFLRFDENVRGKDCFLIQPTCRPVNETLMELLIMADACFRASARRVTAVVPYYGYARQDRKHESRVPITARLVADLLEAARVSRVITMDLHAGQIQGFFKIPVDNLYASPIVIKEIRKLKLENYVIVAPDAGGAKMARAYARMLGVGLVIVDKRRPQPNVAEVMNVIGDVKGRNCVLVDDLVDTAGTLTEAAGALKDHGAKGIYAFCTHPVLSGNALERIESSPLKKVFVTDSIPVPTEKRIRKIKVVTTARLFAKAIDCIHNNDSVSSLFGGNLKL
jgi:ribose-phosphate pyrophosphokinase